MAADGIIAGLQLLRQPNFARGFVAYLVSYLGTAMAPIALAFGVLELTGSASTTAYVIAAPTAAQIAVVLVGGALADRTSRQYLLVGADFTAMSAQLLIAWLFLSGTASLPLLIGLMLINGTAHAFAAPAMAGFIPQLVTRSELQAANALLALARNSAFTVGAAIAGMLVAFVGAGVAILIDALTFAVSGVLIASMRPAAQQVERGPSLVHELRLGWQEFTRHKWLWTIVLQFTVIMAALQAVWGLLGPAVTRDQMGGAADWGFVAATMGVGTLTGGLIALRIRVRRPMLTASFCVFFFALLPLALSVPAPLVILCLASFAGGVSGELFGVLWMTTLHKTIPGPMLSRVAAYDHLGSLCLAPLGVVAGGLLYESIGARLTLLVAAGLVIVPTLAVLMVREVRELEVHG